MKLFFSGPVPFPADPAAMALLRFLFYFLSSTFVAFTSELLIKVHTSIYIWFIYIIYVSHLHIVCYYCEGITVLLLHLQLTGITQCNLANMTK